MLQPVSLLLKHGCVCPSQTPVQSNCRIGPFRDAEHFIRVMSAYPFLIAPHPVDGHYTRITPEASFEQYMTENGPDW